MLAPPLYPGIEQAYIDILEHLVHSHPNDKAQHAAPGPERLGLSFQLEDPRERLPYLPACRINPVQHYAEALWHLTGRDDLGMLVHYIPRMKLYARDGTTLPGPAYGSRIFNVTAETSRRSPFDDALSILRTEPTSKHALLPLFAPSGPDAANTPDASRPIALQLLVRDRRLHMVVYAQSNDCERGLPADVFAFTMLQEYAAARLGLTLGTYTHHIGSAYVVDRNLERVRRVLDEAATRRFPTPPRFPFPAMPPETTRETLITVLKHEEALRADKARYGPSGVADLALPPYWQQVVLLFEAHRQIVYYPADPVESDVLASLDAGPRWLLAHCYPTRMPRGFEPVW
ncbi:thymidylate synthase [Streptomyces sp. NPDC050095]|uniref:thymidylate synthase n=1 Tax=unclassified Streptomyces TaxID=2593676 RepID=UPI0034323BF3